MAIVHQLVSLDDKEIEVVEVEVLVKKIDGVAGDATCCPHLISGQCNESSHDVNKSSHDLNYRDIQLKYHIDPLTIGRGQQGSVRACVDRHWGTLCCQVGVQEGAERALFTDDMQSRTY